MINLEWIRTFSSIFECGNITEASKKLHMTQPGVSKQLAALEHHIGKKLFERTTRKVIPTEYGKFLYAQITSPLKALEKVEHYSSNRTKKERPSIVIGCSSDFFKKELLHKIYALDMFIVTQFGTHKELITSLEDEKIQLLVGTEKYDSFPHQFSIIKEDSLVLVASKDISIPANLGSEKTQITKWLQKQTWFSYDNDLTDINKFWETNFNHKPQLVAQYILPSYGDMLEAIQLTPGFCVLPLSLCEEALQNGTIHTPFTSLKNVDQRLFCAHKLKNEGLDEIRIFKEKMNF